MALRYIGTQLGTFAAVLVAGSLLFGFGLPVLLSALLLGLVAVLALAAWDAKTGRYRRKTENLFAPLTDDQLHECYHAYQALMRGETSRSMLFYSLVTRYEDAQTEGFDAASADLLAEISQRWNTDQPNRFTVAG